MTMLASVVNRGNRTGDVLQVRQKHADGTETVRQLKRGDVADIEVHYHEGTVYEIQSVMGDDDDWVGNPQLTVTDPPRGSTT